MIGVIDLMTSLLNGNNSKWPECIYILIEAVELFFSLDWWLSYWVAAAETWFTVVNDLPHGESRNGQIFSVSYDPLVNSAGFIVAKAIFEAVMHV